MFFFCFVFFLNKKKGLCSLELIGLIDCAAAVRGRRVGDVPHRKPKALLHGHEKTGPEKAAEGDQTAGEPVHGDILRPVQLQKVGRFFFDENRFRFPNTHDDEEFVFAGSR